MAWSDNVSVLDCMAALQLLTCPRTSKDPAGSGRKGSKLPAGGKGTQMVSKT